MTESHTIPTLAKTALGYELTRHKSAVDAIGMQTCEAMGLDVSLDYIVNFDAGTITREVPDPPAVDPAPPADA